MPEYAQLLGAFGSTGMRLPEQAASGEGLLMLFSLADQEIVGISKPVRFVDSIR